MRLLVVTSTWPLSSTDRRTPFVRDLAVDLVKRGWDIEVVAPHASGAARYEMDNLIGVHRFQYMVPESLQTLAYGAGGLVNFRSPQRKLQALPFVVAQTAAIRQALKRFRPHVIHAHWLLPQGFTAALATWRLRIPIVTTIHGSDVFGLRSPVFRLFKKAAANIATAITCNGPATYKAMVELGTPADKVKQIPFAPSFEGAADPSEVASFRARFPKSATIVLFVGRLIPEKGPADFIEAIARTPNLNIHGVICGDGPMLSELQKLAAMRDISNRIAFEGWLRPHEIAVRMAGASALLFPSKTSVDGGVEGQGIVPLEAMRARLPVFAARSGGIPNIVREDETGWLFDEADVAAMSKLLELRAGDGPPGRDAIVNRAERFARSEITRDKTADAFHELFVSICAQHSCRTADPAAARTGSR